MKNEFDMPSNMLLPLFKDMEKRNIKLRAGHYLAALEHVGGAESSDIRQLLDQMAALRSDPRLCTKLRISINITSTPCMTRNGHRGGTARISKMRPEYDRMCQT